MTEIYSFSLNNSLLKGFVESLKKNRQLSTVISELLQKKFEEQESIEDLKFKLKRNEKDIINLKKEIKDKKKYILEKYEQVIKELNDFYSGKGNISNIQKFIDFHSKEISNLTSEPIDKVVNKILNKVKK